MGSENFQSPNAIPPRTSSNGIFNLSGVVDPSKPVLRPVAESDWLSPHKRTSSVTGIASPRGKSMAWEEKDWAQEKEKIVLGPFDYVAEQPGKDIRKQLVQAFNVWLKVPSERLEKITKVIGMLHNASLLYVLLL
jgi:geranylgeranyl diphosphate synthase type 3